jgi:hypothetical protein
LVEPIAFDVAPDDRVVVTVRQVVRNKSGAVLADQTVTHVYRFAGGLVAEMAIPA